MTSQLHTLTSKGLKHNARAIAGFVSQFKTKAEWQEFIDKFREEYEYNPENTWINSKSLGYEGLATIERGFNFEEMPNMVRRFKKYE